MITISQTEFPTGDILIQGLTDIAGATSVLVGENKAPVETDGSFEFTIPGLGAGSYKVPVVILDQLDVKLENETFTINVVDITPVDAAVVSDPVVLNVAGTTHVAPDAQALIDLNKSTVQTYVQRYQVGHETDTSHVAIYPGSQTGFVPLSASAHSASKADEFKIMDDAALAKNPSAGFTGGRGTGNPAKFGRFPERALMTDVRGEFFPKNGDFNANTLKPYPLGRTGDLLENQIIPVGFTQKDPATGYSTTTTRGGVNASPLPSSGFTF